MVLRSVPRKLLAFHFKLSCFSSIGCRVNCIEQVAICQFRPLFCSDVHAQNDIFVLTSNFSDDDKRGFCNAMFQTLHECTTFGTTN